MIPGPPGTIIATGADGRFGVWSIASGAPLATYSTRDRSGSIHYAHYVRPNLYAATEIGGTHVVDLSLLERDRCDVLRRIWAEQPFVWDGGAPVAREPPADHVCR